MKAVRFRIFTVVVILVVVKEIPFLPVLEFDHTMAVQVAIFQAQTLLGLGGPEKAVSKVRQLCPLPLDGHVIQF